MPASPDPRGVSPAATIYRARHVLPLGDDPTRVVDDGGVCVRDGRIAAIGPIDELRREFPDAREVGGRDRVALPGLVDGHQHGRPVNALGHGVRDQPLELWLLEQRAAPSLDPYLAARLTGARLLAAGITSAAHPHLAGPPDGYEEEILATVRGYRDAGLRVRVGVDVRDRGVLTYDDDEDFLATLPAELAEPVHRTWGGAHTPDPARVDEAFAHATRLAEGTLVQVGLAPRGPQWCRPQTLEWLAGHAANGTHLQTHCAETRAQYGHFARQGTSPVRFLADRGLLGPGTTLAHCVWLDREDLDVLAGTGTHVVHNPASNLRLRSGISPVATLRAAGVSPALGSDSMGVTDDRIDLFAAARLALDLERLGLPDDEPYWAAERFAAHLSAGAVALGLPEGVGRLTVGGPADLVLLDWDALVAGMSAGGAEDVVGTVLARADARWVRDVVVDGRHVVADGVDVGVDVEALEAEVAGRLGHPTDPLPDDVTARRGLVRSLRDPVAARTAELAAEVADDVFVGHPTR